MVKNSDHERNDPGRPRRCYAFEQLSPKTGGGILHLYS